MNEFQDDLPDTVERTRAERHISRMRDQGGVFVEAVRLTRMPMMVTDATLPGNPITFANTAMEELSGYSADELLGQDPHFMNGPKTDPEAVRRYQASMAEGRDENLELLQYRKDGTTFCAALFASPLDDGQGTVTNHFLSYLDITRRHDAERDLRRLTAELERRVAERTEELEQANARLREVDAERQMLMVEVNHRAKNSLAVASSLLHIQARRQPDAAVKRLFEEACERLNAMARVHDLLSKAESAQQIDLAVYVGALCEALRALTGDGERIELRAEAQQGIMLAADTAFPLGIVLTELVTNALKYAFPPPRRGSIVVGARRASEGRVEVLVRDDGVGMGAPRDGSLGYGLVRSLTKQMRGDLDVRGEGGVSVTITFPDRPGAG
jgi:PAS domain S-box-containing protein